MKISRTSSGLLDAWDESGVNVGRAIKERDRPGHRWRVHLFVTGRDWSGLDLSEALAVLEGAHCEA